MRLDKTRGGVLESKTFHGGNPSLRPDACCHHSMYRAFVLPAVVSRSPSRTRKERSAGLTHPQEASPVSVTTTRTHLVLVESIGPAPAEGAVNLVGSELGEPREASDQKLRCIGARRLAQEAKPGSGPTIRIPKSPYGLNLKIGAAVDQNIIDEAVRIATRAALRGCPVKRVLWVPTTLATLDPLGAFVVIYRQPSGAAENDWG